MLRKALTRLLKWPRCHNLLARALKREWFCRIYGHTYQVFVNKEAGDLVIIHSLYCQHCRDIFGYLRWPYSAYVIRGVNPQYGITLKEWFIKIGLLEVVYEKLISNLQKFRTDSLRKLRESREAN